VTNPSLPSEVVSKAPAVVGKSVEPVPPAMYALPPPSTVTSLPLSKPAPPS
jgi:hypothetical protein